MKKTTKVDDDVYRIRTADANYCLKKYPFPEDDVRFIARVFSYLIERGFERGQRLFRTLEQQPYMEHEGFYYTLTNWVTGHRPQFQKHLDYKSAIRTLAKFHGKAEGFPSEEAPPSRTRYDQLNGELGEYRALLGKYKSTAHLVPLCDEVLFLSAQPNVMEAVASERRLSAFVHGDYNYPNMIKDRHYKLHLIDFENSSLNLRMRDLSHILHRNCHWDGLRMLRVIECYQSRRPLGVYDTHLLHALLTAPYPVVRDIRIGGLRRARSVIPSAPQLRKYQRELKELL